MKDYWTFVGLAFCATAVVLGGLLWASLRSRRLRREALSAAGTDSTAEGSAGEAQV